jgi:glycerophosphoryl diester phosphodiesterase
MSYQSWKVQRIEPIFKLQTPVLFAHRGGVWETPESTIMGFKHALENARADVLELDVQLTKDGEFIVWHGPDLDNVKIMGQSDRPVERKKRKIHHFKWRELEPGKAWVADPEVKLLDEKDIDLADVDMAEDRCLLSLSDFLKKFPDVPLNIEMKKSFKRKINESDRRGLRDNIKAFSEILTRDGGKRPIVVVSGYDDFIDEFRRLNGSKFSTGLSVQEQLLLRIIDLDMTNRSLETTYLELLSSERIIEKVRRLGGSTFVFLTAFGPIRAIDNDEDEPEKKQIFKILDRGVDGIMTDRPQRVRKMIDEWIKNKEG